mmetsp:Transcript_57507/g.51804  ORF Transcript_57507/g.51804 Transcript_57507/m.51804 type:complete len:269 (+) Transcript_57507:105-911(+)
MGETFTREKVARYAAEFSGTMFLIMFIKLAVVYDDYTTSLSIGLGLALLIYNYGYISGAHLNPAVTMAIIIRNVPDFPLSEKGQIVMYFVSQYTGAVFGGIMATLIGGNESAAVFPTVFRSEDDLNNSDRLFQAFMGEIFFTYLLCTTVCHCATDKRQSGNQFYGLAIGLSLSLGCACLGPISGSCLNSAVWFGTVIPAIITDQVPYGLSDLWVYWAGTFIGGIVAGLWFNLLNGRESLGKPGVYGDGYRSDNREELQNLQEEDTEIE